MADNRFPRLRQTGRLLSEWAKTKQKQYEVKRHALQQELEPRESFIDEERGYSDTDRFTDRKAKRKQLKEYHKIRKDGGIVAALLQARALMVFGVGGQYTAEQDAVAEWVNNQFENLTLDALDIGTDGYFYGYALTQFRETVDGNFGELEFIQPWTTIPKLDNKGDVYEYQQKIKHGSGTSEKTFQPDDLYHFTVRKQSGRDPVGMSMLGQVMTEATAYHDNQQAIQNAVQLHGFPKWHIKVGPEDGATIDDNELRRVRPKFNNIDELTKWITGQDVDIDVISPEGFEFEQITEHDLSKLAIAMMLPVEMTQLGGGDGLGTGFPARLRERMFLLSANADQQMVGNQLATMAKDMIDEYAPPEIEALVGDLDEFDLRYEFNDPITDLDELQSKADAIGPDMTVNERRQMFDLPPLDDDEIGKSFEPPGQTEPEAPGDEDTDIAMQEGNLAQNLIEWIRTYAGESGDLDDRIGQMREWLDDFADEPATVNTEFDNGVTLFANEQGVTFEEAIEQPVNNLLTYYAENRNLAEADSGNANSEDVPEPEELLAEIQAYRAGFEAIVWAELEHDLAGPSFGNDDDVPANVRNRLEEASRFVEWADTDGIPPGNLREFFVRKLEQPQGWSIGSLAEGLRSEFGARLGEPDERVNIARTKSAALLNQAKRMAFEDLEEGIEGDLLYFWDGPQDEDTTDACEEFKQLTNPEHGGTPRPRQEFDRLMQELRREYFPDFTSSGDAIHWQERHALDAVLPSEADVNPAGVGGMAKGATD